MNAWKWAGLAALAAASAAIFAAYLRPDTMVSLTNAFLALCGFKQGQTPIYASSCGDNRTCACGFAGCIIWGKH